MKVLKFGGSSVGTVDSINKVIAIVLAQAKNAEITLVCSAFSGVTDSLLQMLSKASLRDDDYLGLFALLKKKCTSYVNQLLSKEANKKLVLQEIKSMLGDLEDLLKGVYLIRECSPKTSDAIVSFGERLSNFVISEALNERGLKSVFVDARELVKTDANFTCAEVDFSKTNKNIRAYFKDLKGLPVVTGFLGSTEDAVTTTLGRGGSDYTAAIFGAALDVKQIEIWTDVDGVMSADPRKVKDAFVLENLSYHEAMEMSHFGAKVLHPKTMAPAVDKAIPILIKNTFNHTASGTVISKKSDDFRYGVKGVTSIKDVSLLTLSGVGMMGMPGIANRLFKSVASEGINIILISQASSEHSICFAVRSNEADSALKAIEKEFKLEMKAGIVKKVHRLDDLAILAVVGDKMRGAQGVAGRLFNSLSKNGVNIVAIAQGSSERNISFAINANFEEIALNSIHDAFFLDDTKVHAYIVGTGVVGASLLDQIASQKATLEKEFGVDLKVNGITNSRNMLLDADGVDLSDWRKELDFSGEKSNLAEFIDKAADFRLHNAVFVDCTASESIADLYDQLFEKNFSIVTPNKKANSSSYAYYKKLQDLRRKYRKSFFYETNVGAGLPVINTLQDLIKSGDKVLKIEGILSGTLSFIFNSFNGSKPFSQIVREAKEKGYTEPDPRDDLSGEDFARKLLILAREIGLSLEMKDVKIENLSPPECRKAKSVDEFLVSLAKYDSDFEKRRSEAEKKNCVLRYVGSLEDKKARVALEVLPKDHPFAELRGSDNIISFTTQRYSNTPLIVRGPGAGAQVTAAGVFADILRLASKF